MDIKLNKPKFVKVSSLENAENGYNVYVQVVSVEASNNQEGKLPIAKAVVADETGAANAFFKGENVKLIKVGSTIAIRNGTIRYIKNHISLEIDVFGRITPENIQIKPKIDFNISQGEAKRRPRRRNYQRNDNRQDHRNYDRHDKRPQRHSGERQRKPREDRQRRPRRQGQEQRPQRKKREEYDRPPRNQNHKSYEERKPRGQYRGDFNGQRKSNFKWTKIGGIQPGDDNLNILAKVLSTKEVGKKLRVVIGDETGIVNAFFYQNDAIKVGNTIAIFKAQAQVIKQHIEIQLMERGKVDQGRRKVEQVDEKVNISAKEWIEADE